MFNILVVEDEKPINDLISMNLDLVGYNHTSVFDGETAIRVISEQHFHLILLDIMIPMFDGFEIAEMIKKRSIPIIFITARDSISDKIKGFELGAEDYIVKPFEMLELLARIKVVLRNKYLFENEYKIDNTTINISQHKVYVNEEEVFLTKTEFDLLAMLINNKNIALSRDKILENVCGYDGDLETRTVDVYIQKIRKKLKLEKRIKTVYKVGYRLEF